MIRRDFFGSILGLFSGCNIDWKAYSLFDPEIDQPDSILKNYKTAVRLNNGLIIQGPGIKDIDKEKGFIYHSIKMHKELVVEKCILIYKNKIVSKRKFDSFNYILMFPGDTLNISHDCTINYNGELIKPTDSNWEFILEKYLGDK